MIFTSKDKNCKLILTLIFGIRFKRLANYRTVFTTHLFDSIHIIVPEKKNKLNELRVNIS